MFLGNFVCRNSFTEISKGYADSTPTEVDKKIETKAEYEETESNRELQQLIANGSYYYVFILLRRTRELKKKINSDGNTLLHIAVGKGLNSLTEDILMYLRDDDEDLTKITNADGSTVLHIAAIVGNTDAARMLVSKNKDLLNTKDNEGLTPLGKAYKNMHLDTSAYLLGATEMFGMGKECVEANPERNKDAGDEAKPTPHLPSVEIGINLLVHAVSAKRYDFALKLIMDNSEYATSKDDVLMAMARTFPSGLEHGETLIYPSFEKKKKSHDMIVKRTKRLFDVSIIISSILKDIMEPILSCEEGYQTDLLNGVIMLILFVPIAMGHWMYCLILLLLMMVYIPFSMLYFLLWKAAAKVVPPIKNIKQKKKEYEQAKVVLERLCGKMIEKWPGSRSVDLFKEPILEAARENAYEVVEEILQKRPEAIHCEDNNGYDIIQLATIHHSERIYNMIYILGERTNIYRTMEDSYNNMLHLVGRLAPSNKLKRITGATLQLQRELQWRQEVKKLLFPTYVNKVNIFMETPEMVFMKENENLVKEEEQWMKNVAKSCSITAALITTIVFVAAITVPGGSKETGVPVFLKEIFFTVFAVSNAISLFSSSTSLLLFLSNLTARCSEEDFLVRLPRQLIIGLCTLLISTTTMIVAFIATLFLVFFHHAKWMLAPICGLGFLPIAIFFIIQIPLIIDLFRSTYVPRFGKSDIKSHKFNPNALLFFNK